MVKYRKVIFALLIIAAFIASLAVLTVRIKNEKANSTVDICLDYDSLISLCRDEALDEDNTLRLIKDAGITSLAFSEVNIDRLQDEGKLRWMTGSQLQGFYSLSGTAENRQISGISPSCIYIINASPEVKETLKKNFEILMGKDILREISIPVADQASEKGTKSLEALELKGNIRELPFIGIGFEEDKMKKVHSMGFNLVLRPENRNKMDAEAIKNYLTTLGKTPGVKCFVYGGTNEVLGYPLNLDGNVDAIKETGVSFGDIEAPNEKARQKGATYIALKVLDQVVRVQSISPQYLEKMTPEDAIDMFRLGVRERNIRLLYLRPYPRGIDEKSVLQTNLDYFALLKKEIGSFGYKTGDAGRFPLSSPSPIAVILISLGAAAAFLLLMDRYYYDNGYIALAILLIALLFPAALAFTGKLHIAQKLIGLVLGLVFPIYALAVHFEEMEFIETRDKLTKVLGYALSMMLKVSLITILGGLMLAALFSSTSFMLGVDRVKGVKALLFLPPIITAVLYYIKGTDKRQKIESMLKTPLYLWQVAVLGIMGALGIVYMMRSGNAGEAITTDFERQLRVAMEQIMWVRPRFKDFILGHPSMMITWALAYMHKYAGLGIFILFASVGQADIIDTFAHVHTPLFISLVRVINGLILGTIIGSAAIGIYWLIRNFFNKKDLPEAPNEVSR